jgi:hypothetical protein
MIIVFVTINSNNTKALPLAGISALVGLWLAKHVWLVIPQLLPMS